MGSGGVAQLGRRRAAVARRGGRKEQRSSGGRAFASCSGATEREVVRRRHGSGEGVERQRRGWGEE